MDEEAVERMIVMRGLGTGFEMMIEEFSMAIGEELALDLALLSGTVNAAGTADRGEGFGIERGVCFGCPPSCPSSTDATEGEEEERDVDDDVDDDDG